MILAAVAKQPDITLAELRELLAGHGVSVGRKAVATSQPLCRVGSRAGRSCNRGFAGSGRRTRFCGTTRQLKAA